MNTVDTAVDERQLFSPGRLGRSPDEMEEIHLRDYFLVLAKRRRLILVVFLVVTLVAAIHTFRQPDVFSATTRILIEKRDVRVFFTQDLISFDTSTKSYYQTQYELVRSVPVIERTLARLKDVRPQSPILQAGDPVSALKYSLMVDEVKDTRMMDVTMEGHDPVEIAAVLNALAEEYIAYGMELRYDQQRYAREWLAEELGAQQAQAAKAEKGLQDFKERENIGSLDEMRGMLAAKMVEFNESFVQSRTRRMELEGTLKKIRENRNRPSSLETIPVLFNNETIRELRQRTRDLESELVGLSKIYTERHPKVLAKRTELDQIESQIDAEISRLVESLETERKLLEENESTMQAAIDKLNKDALQLSEKEMQYRKLERQVQADHQLYDQLLDRFRQSDISGGMEMNNISIVETAAVPDYPIRPNRPRNVFLGVLVGLVLSISLALFVEYLDTSLKTPEDIERYIGLQVTGVIPAQPAVVEGVPAPEEEAKKARRPRFRLGRLGASRPVRYGYRLATVSAPRSHIAEAFRTLRTNVQFLCVDRNVKRIVVNSSGPEEGKTSTLCNLAVAFAQTGGSVLIVDSDLRRPAVHKAFQLPNIRGVTNYLIGEVSLERVIQPTFLENLSVITSGPVPPNPVELVGSRSMANMLDELDSQFDLIFIDSPPVLSVADGLILSSLAHGVLFVIEANRLSRDLVRRGYEQLAHNNAPLLGSVLNNVDTGKAGSYYQYYYYYAYTPYLSPDRTRSST